MRTRKFAFEINWPLRKVEELQKEMWPSSNYLDQLFGLIDFNICFDHLWKIFFSNSKKATLKDVQLMYIQMEFCDNQTLRSAIDKDLYKGQAYDMFSRNFRIPIYEFFLPNMM